MQDAIETRVSASWIPEWGRRRALGNTWETNDREIKPDATVHPSVDERFALPSVVQCDRVDVYRPAPLANHVRFKDRYGTAPIPGV